MREWWEPDPRSVRRGRRLYATAFGLAILGVGLGFAGDAIGWRWMAPLGFVVAAAGIGLGQILIVVDTIQVIRLFFRKRPPGS